MNNDIFEMWALWHWRLGLAGKVHRTRREVKEAAIERFFVDEADYRKHVGKMKPYRIVKVEVQRATS